MAPSTPLTRRQFLRLASAGVLASALSACGQAPVTAPPPPAVVFSQNVYREAPLLAELTAAGSLPPVAERLPSSPMLITPLDRPGSYGGSWNLVKVGNDHGVVTRTVSYEGLVRWDRAWTKVIPNVAQSFTVNADATVYTFKLRKGMRWSDGAPFGADDILFWYHDIFRHPDLVGTPFYDDASGWANAIGDVTRQDDQTVSFHFDTSQGLFLQTLASMIGRMPVLCPKHYLAQFHPAYTPDLAARSAAEGVKNWVELLGKYHLGSSSYYVKNPELPTLDAWVLAPGTSNDDQVTPGRRFAFHRNPYYWKIDTEYQQLPYIDQIEVAVVESNDVATSLAIAGQVDMQNRHILPAAYDPAAMSQGGYRSFAMVTTFANDFVIWLNLTADDPAKRALFQNRDLRIGLSYAINRAAIIAALGGDLIPSQVAPIEGTPFYNEQMANQYLAYDPQLANQHLDATGFSERDAEGYRLGPDGKRISIMLVLPDPNPFRDYTPYIQQITVDWQAVGVELRTTTMARADFDLMLSPSSPSFNQYEAMAWSASGGYDVIAEPSNYLPQQSCRFALRWGVWVDKPTDPQAAEPPAAAREQIERFKQLQQTADPDLQEALMQQILAISAEQFYTIGVNRPPNPMGVVHQRMHNVPAIMPNSWNYPNPAPTNPCQYFIAGV